MSEKFTGTRHMWTFMLCVVWNFVNMATIVAACANQSESLAQWLFTLVNRCNQETLQNLAMVLWSIWKYRNDKLWNDIDRPARINILLASDLASPAMEGSSNISANRTSTNEDSH